MTTFVVVLSAAASAQTLTQAMDRAMAGHSGGAVVLAVKSGDVLAKYRPEAMGRRVARPGSAIKPFVVLELLQSGKISANTAWSCRRRVQVGSHNLDCQHVRTVEAMNAERALAYSCNSYFAEMGARLSDAEFAALFRRWGFGSPTRLLANEAAGVLRGPMTREGLKLAAVGEDGVAVTPIQVAAAYRKLAVQAQNPDASMTVVMAGLRGAVQYGTAQGARVDDLNVAGKTGTATAKEGAWTHAWFAGIAPAEKPEVVIVVFLERGHGSEAAEIAGKVLQAWSGRGRR